MGLTITTTPTTTTTSTTTTTTSTITTTTSTKTTNTSTTFTMTTTDITTITMKITNMKRTTSRPMILLILNLMTTSIIRIIITGTIIDITTDTITEHQLWLSKQSFISFTRDNAHGLKNLPCLADSIVVAINHYS